MMNVLIVMSVNRMSECRYITGETFMLLIRNCVLSVLGIIGLPQCVEVCPVDCIDKDPDHVEDHERCIKSIWSWRNSLLCAIKVGEKIINQLVISSLIPSLALPQGEGARARVDTYARGLFSWLITPGTELLNPGSNSLNIQTTNRQQFLACALLNKTVRHRCLKRASVCVGLAGILTHCLPHRKSHFLPRNEYFMTFRQLQQQLFINGFDKAHVDNGCA